MSNRSSDCHADPAQGCGPRRLRAPAVARLLSAVAVTVAAGLSTAPTAPTAPTAAAAAADTPQSEGAEPQVGQPAPDFGAVDSAGRMRHLGEFKGKIVVLEWTNADCPYTRKHYSSGNMQSTQQLARDHGVVWLSVISSAPGTQGYVTGAQADELSRTRHAVPSAVLLDASGTMGHTYHAKTTPHLFVIDAQGVLRYMGGMDSIATADVADIAHAEPYLKEALLAVVEGKPVEHPVTRPYGCSIKYR
jgi:peroxiredoxin